MVADLAYTLQTTQEALPLGSWIDPIYLIAATCLGGVVWQPAEAAAISSPPEGGRRRDLIVPAVFAAVMICLFAMQYFSATSALSTVLWAATITAVIARLAMSDRENKSLLEQVRTDSLTGLGSRGRVQVDLPARFAEATVEQPISLVLLDLNGFKHFNDSFGHPAGDALLIRLGAALRDAVGSAGIAYRFGGDEFCLLLTCPAGAIRRSHRGRGPRAQRQRRRLRHQRLLGLGRDPGRGAGPRRGARARRCPDVREQGLAAGGDHRLGAGRAGRDACRLPRRDRITSADKAIPSRR